VEVQVPGLAVVPGERRDGLGLAHDRVQCEARAVHVAGVDQLDDLAQPRGPAGELGRLLLGREVGRSLHRHHVPHRGGDVGRPGEAPAVALPWGHLVDQPDHVAHDVAHVTVELHLTSHLLTG
jgi:hypothetical protein